MCLCRGKQSLEEYFPHQNWVIILSFQLLISTIFAVMSPSIYQYVTSSSTISEELINDEDKSRYWPGLGGSDTDYGWVLGAHPLFEAGTLPLTVIIVHRLPFCFLLYTYLCLAAVGGVMYALAESVWIAFAGRALMGAGISVGAASIHTYIGEMGTMMDNIRENQGKKPRKFLLYIAHSFALNGGIALPYILNAVMAKFKDVNPYRWPGWSVTALAGLLGLLVLLFFTETRSLSRVKFSTMKCTCLTALKLSAQLKSKSKIRFLTYIFVMACGYTVGKVYTFLFTLVTPVLSDQFGFNVEHTSHYLIGVSAAYLSSSFIHLGAKVARIDNRNLLGLCLLFAFVGSMLVGDWQSIFINDPCSAATVNVNEVFDFQNESSPANLNYSMSGFNSSDNVTAYEQLVASCEALSSSSHQCSFNPNSHITGEFCNTCMPTCLSKQATINFYQFSAGILLLSLSAPLGFIFASAIASEITSVESQGAVLSLVVGSGAFGRAVSPIWFVESYELSGRHTYFAAAITAGCALMLLISLAVLYKHLAPITKKACDTVVVKATSKLSLDMEIISDADQAMTYDIFYVTPL